MHALDARQVIQLGAAGEAVGEDGRIVACRADRGEQGGFRDRDRDVVVAPLDAEAAATATLATE